MSEAARMNEGKAMLAFLLQFPTAAEAFARVKEVGAIKYERDNWKKGNKPDWEYLDACLRHLFAFVNGEYYAQDTGCSHLAHAAWNLFALQDLNYAGCTHDKQLFKTMCEHWAGKKRQEPTTYSDEDPRVAKYRQLLENYKKNGCPAEAIPDPDDTSSLVDPEYFM